MFGRTVTDILSTMASPCRLSMQKIRHHCIKSKREAWLEIEEARSEKLNDCGSINKAGRLQNRPEKETRPLTFLRLRGQTCKMTLPLDLETLVLVLEDLLLMLASFKGQGYQPTISADWAREEFTALLSYREKKVPFGPKRKREGSRWPTKGS